MIEINELGTHESLIYFPNKRLKVKKVINYQNFYLCLEKLITFILYTITQIENYIMKHRIHSFLVIHHVFLVLLYFHLS